MSASFPIRMLYATTPQAREKAAEMGCNWACVHSLGHKAHRSLENPLPGDDLPLYLSGEPRVASLRRSRRRQAVEFERRILRESVAHAHRLGLKAMIHSYEVSLPPELREIFPSLYRPMVREYRDCSEDTRRHRAPCLADPRVRDLVRQKVAETVAVVPDLDAYAFSFNECLSQARIGHRCELCREVPFWQMILWLADAVREGVQGVNPGIRFFHRLWGVQEHDDVYLKNLQRQHGFQKPHFREAWLPRHIRVYAPENMHYKPSVQLREYLRRQRGTDMGFVAKATWADVSIDMPPNPWLRDLKGHDTIVELSFESASAQPEQAGFHVLGRQFRRMARHARACGCSGVAGIPVDWGDKYNEAPSARGSLKDGYWRLSGLNFDVVEALMRDPDADLAAAAARGLRKRYGVRLPRRLAECLLESQAVRAGTVNVRGVQVGTGPLEDMFQTGLRYGPTVPGWQARLSRSPANLRRIFAEKDRVMAQADRLLADVREYRGRIPARAFDDVLLCFTALRDLARGGCSRQKLNFLLWALKEGTIPCDLKVIRDIEAQVAACR